MKKVSIKDVAQAAGVSLTTVSLILNGHQRRFPQKTIDRVIATKDALGYIPNQNAQQLRKNYIKLIGVLIPSLTNPFFSAMIQSMAQHKRDDVDLFFLSTPEAEIEDNIKHLVARGMDGLVIARFIHEPEEMDAYLKKHHVPYVVLDQSEDNDFTDMIRTDEFAGGRLAAEHLIQRGHQKLVIVHPEPMMSNMQERVKGFEQYCEEQNIVKPIKIATSLSMHGGKKIAQELINSKATAAFAINDEMAIGMMRGLAEKGVRVPDDFSIIGYDNIDIAQFMTPALTTVAQPIEDIGERALQLIMKKIEKPLSNVEKMILPNSLVIRETTQLLK